MFAFRAMNTDVAVTALGDEEVIAGRIAATFADAERRFSRFREDSELSALNRAEGPFVASPQLFDMLWRARSYVELTDGLFDPTIGGLLSTLGCDRSFAPGALDRAQVSPPPRTAQFVDIVLNRATRSVLRPPHIQIDLGGMAKGHAVDRAAAHLGESGAIDAGGDAFARGPAPDGREWLVDIEDPGDPSRTVATLAVANAAVATSAPNRRWWRVGSDVAHHLIDPRTRLSSTSDLLQATVVAASAELADVLAKTAFLLGARDGQRFLERQPHCGGVLVRASGAPLFVGELDVCEVAHA
jgi:thiamine biosynthesis lipoprotein